MSRSDPAAGHVASGDRNFLKRDMMPEKGIRILQNFGKFSIRKPRADALIAGDDASSRLNDSRHFEESRFDVGKDVEATKVKNGIKMAVGKRQPRCLGQEQPKP